jgi:prefoldin subunit 5
VLLKRARDLGSRVEALGLERDSLDAAIDALKLEREALHEAVGTLKAALAEKEARVLDLRDKLDAMTMKYRKLKEPK